MSVNKVILVGRIGSDLKLQETKSGTVVCNFSLATSEKRKGEEKTEWHYCSAFGNTAQNLCDFMSKGKQIYIDGKLQTDKYEKDGVQRSSTKIICNQIQFLGGKPEGQQSLEPKQNYQPPVNLSDEISFDDDDIPF